MADIYHEVILEHWKNPKNKGKIKNPDFTYEIYNPFCGDKIKIYIKANKNIIKDVKFEGKGCAISQAGASLLTEKVKNKSISYAKKLDKEDMLKMLNLKEISPIREKCMMISLNALKGALKNKK
ncbi:Zinc-dependent sulfurtransferase SufU [bacterium HR34]|nr:Zinc-dependent sulfurtransferase SufU [bacterium HR34]